MSLKKNTKPRQICLSIFKLFLGLVWLQQTERHFSPFHTSSQSQDLTFDSVSAYKHPVPVAPGAPHGEKGLSLLVFMCVIVIVCHVDCCCHCLTCPLEH